MNHDWFPLPEHIFNITSVLTKISISHYIPSMYLQVEINLPHPARPTPGTGGETQYLYG